MGFWKALGETALKAGKSAAKSAKTALNDIDKYKTEFRKYDDEKLKQVLKRGGFSEKAAATALLKERGYGKE